MIVRTAKRGFSLLELIIVLGVLGVLLAGLFQLTSASTRQINAQIAAQQLQQWIKGYKAYVNARTNSTGTTFLGYTAGTCAAAADVSFAVGDNKDITANVQCFKQGNLPIVAPNGGSYKVYMSRMADVAGKGSYALAATISGGRAYDDSGAGSVAAYVGAEGATSFPAGIDADDAATTCNEATATLRGAFGAICANVSSALYDAYAPSTLSFISMLDVGTTDSNFLWRVSAPNAELNKMTVDQGMKPGVSLKWDGTSFTATGKGDIVMNQGTLTGVHNIAMDSAGGAANTFGINTSGGLLNTSGGNFSGGGGQIDTGGGSITTGAGDIAAHSLVLSQDLSAVNGTFSGQLQAQSFYYTSDMRLKHDIAPIPDALSKLLKIRGVTFKWNKDGRPDIGIVAQEVQAVYPEAVKTATIDGQDRLVVETGNLVGPLIEAIRELKAQNDDLRTQLDVLRRDVETLKGHN